MSPQPIARTVVVSNRHGLHARPCLAIVNTVNRHQAEVTIGTGTKRANASSIHALMALAVTQGTELVLSATGPDAAQVLETLDHLFASEFGITYPLAEVQDGTSERTGSQAGQSTRSGIHASVADGMRGRAGELSSGS